MESSAIKIVSFRDDTKIRWFVEKKKKELLIILKLGTILEKYFLRIIG